MLTMMLAMAKHMVIDQITPPPMMMAATVVVGILSIADLKYETQIRETTKYRDVVEESVQNQPQSIPSKRKEKDR